MVDVSNETSLQIFPPEHPLNLKSIICNDDSSLKEGSWYLYLLQNSKLQTTALFRFITKKSLFEKIEKLMIKLYTLLRTDVTYWYCVKTRLFKSYRCLLVKTPNCL